MSAALVAYGGDNEISSAIQLPAISEAKVFSENDVNGNLSFPSEAWSDNGGMVLGLNGCGNTKEELVNLKVFMDNGKFDMALNELTAILEARAKVDAQKLQQGRENLGAPLGVAFRDGISNDTNLKTLHDAVNNFDKDWVRSVSSQIVKSKLALEEVTRFFRAQNELDQRACKFIYPDLLYCFGDWFGVDVATWANIVIHGATANVFVNEEEQVNPSNEAGQYSLTDNQKIAILKSVAKEAANNSCLVVEESVCKDWGLVFSPVSAVDKDTDSLRDSQVGRLINDLSYPRGHSVNDRTDKVRRGSVQYGGHSTVSRMIVGRVRVAVLIMSVDISNAFRRVFMNLEDVKFNCFKIPGTSFVVIDMCAEFGWVESPMVFNLGCNVVIALLNAMFGKKLGVSFWVDDGNFICDCGYGEAMQMEFAIILVIRLVFGLDGDNKKKTQSWCRQMETMGLCYDLDLGIVKVPERKLNKLIRKLEDMLDKGMMTRKILDSVVGSGRHIGAVYRGIRPFWDMLTYAQCKMKPWYRARKIPAVLRESVNVLIEILRLPQMNVGVPIEFVAGAAKEDVTLLMDASDVGLCVIWPHKKEYVQYMFPPAIVEKLKGDPTWWTINCREFLSVLVGSLVWGSEWSGCQVMAWIDNISAVSWVNKLEVKNDAKGRAIARGLVAAEVKYGFWLAAKHIAGDDNGLPDAGSRDSAERRVAFENYKRSLGLIQKRMPEEVIDLVSSWY